MSTRTEYPNFVGNTGKFLKVNATETDVLWDDVDASDITGVLGVDHGGTGANNAPDALNNLLPDQTGHTGEVLHTDGTDPYWAPTGGAGGVDTRIYDIPATVTVNTTLRSVFIGLLGGGDTGVTEPIASSPFYENVIVKRIDFYVGSNTVNEDTTVILRKNGIDTSFSQIIPAGTTGQFSFTCNEAFNSTDLFTIHAFISLTATGVINFKTAGSQGSNAFNVMVQVSGGSPLGVQSVTGNGVDNTDPFNPIVQTASSTTEGTLSATDWNTFNNKQNTIITGTLSTSTTGVTVGTGTNRLVGGAATVNIATASGSQQGLLSAADWNTFNGKQDALPTLCLVKAYQSSLGSGGTPFIANTEVFDTTSSYDTATGIFTAPRTGYYLVTGSFSIESHSADPSIASAQIIKNGSSGIDQDSVRYDGTEGASDFWKRRLKLVSTVQLTSGDTIEFDVAVNTGSIGVTGGVEGNQITITELR